MKYFYFLFIFALAFEFTNAHSCAACGVIGCQSEPPNRQVCDEANCRCVECLKDEQCPPDLYCFNNLCQEGEGRKK
ncbi:hypothetical protein Ddc_12492 [Ditylenchus destructor]|nr:hypothetical protein Ddc_12492 [Ditylenchus destructor]